MVFSSSKPSCSWSYSASSIASSSCYSSSLKVFLLLLRSLFTDDGRDYFEYPADAFGVACGSIISSTSTGSSNTSSSSSFSWFSTSY